MKVYFLDDNPHRLRVFLRQSTGCSVQYFSHVENFIEEIKKERPDLILLDYDLDEFDPLYDKNGMDAVLELIPILDKSVPIVIHSLNVAKSEMMQKTLQIAGFLNVQCIQWAWRYFRKIDNNTWEFSKENYQEVNQYTDY